MKKEESKSESPKLEYINPVTGNVVTHHLPQRGNQLKDIDVTQFKIVEEILNRIIRSDKDHFSATTFDIDGAGGSACYTRDDLVRKAMEEYAAQFRDFHRGND